MKFILELKTNRQSSVTFNVFKRTSNNTEQLIATHRYDRRAAKHTLTELGSKDLDKYQRKLTAEQMFDIFYTARKQVNNYLMTGTL